MLWALLGIISYLAVAVMVKVYYKLYRWDGILSDDPYMVGFFWPGYLVWRLILYPIYRAVSWPLINGSRYIEDKIETARENKERAKIRVQVLPTYDPELQAAEREVEELLDNERRMSL